MAEREAAVPEPERIRFRIGINLGDVIHEADGDLYGDGVNVAARLEQLAEPGGVVVSGTAYDQLHGKLDLTLEFAGEQRVKNIERLVRAYRVRLDGTAHRYPIGRAHMVGALGPAGRGRVRGPDRDRRAGGEHPGRVQPAAAGERDGGPAQAARRPRGL